ncbi:hypothetical protein [Candidatus Vampirococcus lugosii]|uniref:hypothetical protein n=1 Tax=Candidatus Vampirococcus lugosii TaxID=2789015 RepID=UPI001BCDF771|nr:hypothetical protein [Candidatus Vampirococcus lugosii]
MVKIFNSNSKRKYYLVVIKNNKGQRMFFTNNLEKIHLRSEVERLNNYYMYAWLEVVEYILHNGKFFRNRNQRNYLQNQQNSLFSLI